MQIGYARVSTHDQTLALQQDALTAAGCDRIFADTLSGAVPAADRPGLQMAWSHLRPADVLVVWKLDRLGRSLRDLIAQIESLHRRGCGFASLTEQIDTSHAAGKLQFHLFSALAEFERDLIRERTRAGLAAARARGRQGGRPPRLGTAAVARAAALMADRHLTVREICGLLGISRSTLYRHVTPDGRIRQPPRSQPPLPTA